MLRATSLANTSAHSRSSKRYSLGIRPSALVGLRVRAGVGVSTHSHQRISGDASLSTGDWAGTATAVHDIFPGRSRGPDIPQQYGVQPGFSWRAQIKVDSVGGPSRPTEIATTSS